MNTTRTTHERAPVRRAVLRKRELANHLGISISSIDRARARGDFPAPIKLGTQTVAWRISDVENWLSSRETKAH